MGAFLILVGLFLFLLAAMAMFSNLSRPSRGSSLLMRVGFVSGIICLIAGFVYFKLQPYK